MLFSIIIHYIRILYFKYNIHSYPITLMTKKNSLIILYATHTHTHTHKICMMKSPRHIHIWILWFLMLYMFCYRWKLWDKYNKSKLSLKLYKMLNVFGNLTKIKNSMFFLYFMVCNFYPPLTKKKDIFKREKTWRIITEMLS